MKYDVINLDNQKKGTLELLDAVFGLEERADILHRVVRWQLAGRRAGTHQTRGISDVSGTTRKPFRQKGTGRARLGSLRAPQCRGGATIFGPQSRDHSMKLPKKIRALGLRTVLSSKVKSGDLIILEDLKLDSSKTKDLRTKIEALNSESILFVDAEKIDEAFRKASSNLRGVDVLPHQGLNVYDVLKSRKLALTKSAIKQLEERLK